jgi:hypothetical protein
LIYLDTSILLVFTLTRSSEIERSPAVDRLFNKISSGAISASTSFYALHELYVFALAARLTVDVVRFNKVV